MFQLYAGKNQLKLESGEPLTSGSVNVFRAQFRFSEDWDGLARTAVFRGGGKAVAVPLDAGGTCVIPWEALARPGGHLLAGVCGTRNGDTVLPTVWTDCGYIQEGVRPGEAAGPPTPGLWEQMLAAVPRPMTSEELRRILVNGGD